jgi:hypothetical protein
MKPVCIIGGGIAGCYIGLQLMNVQDFCIFEAGTIHAGKQQTLKVKGVNIDLGSSEQHLNQVNFLHMISMLKLTSKIQKFENKDPTFLLDGFDSRWLNAFFTSSFKLISENAKTVLPGAMSVSNLCKEWLGENFGVFQRIHPFWFEICDQDAYTYFSCVQREGQYFYLKGGQQQVLMAARNLLKDHISYNSPVKVVEKNIDNSWTLFTDAARINCSKIFVTCNLSAAKKIKWIKCPEIPKYLACAKSMPCLRWFCIFKQPVVLPSKNFSGDNPGKWSFRINDFVWLISYVDGPLVAKVKQGNIVNEWIDFVNKRFGTSIKYEWVEESIAAEWEDAYNILLPSYFTARPQLPENCFITSVAKPCGQAWIEGSLIRL